MNSRESRVSSLNVQFSGVPQTPPPPQTMSWSDPCQLSRRQTFAEFESLRKAVDELAYTEMNWDGYGALPISGEAKRNALTALQLLGNTTPPPAIIPNPNGTLSLEWETERGVGNLEIGKTRYSFYVKPNSGRAILADGEANKVLRFLGAVVEGVLSPKPAEPAFLSLTFSADV